MYEKRRVALNKIKIILNVILPLTKVSSCEDQEIFHCNDFIKSLFAFVI